MQLFVEKNYNSFLANIWLREDRGMFLEYYSIVNNEIIVTKIERGTPPTLELRPLAAMNISLAEDFIKAVAEYAGQNGIQTKKRDFLEGELEATKKHLADLQKAYDALITIKTK